MRPFQPLFLCPHLETLAGHVWRRPFDPVRFPVERRLYRTEPDVQVLVESQQLGSAARGEIVMVHGLEGSGDAGYMRSLSHAGLEAGYAAHRFNLRTCGGTEHLCPTLYHAGLTSDLLAVLREFARPVWLVGFSLGGNVVLKLAGELGEEGRRWIAGVCAVSTPLDLGVCARRIDLRENWLYQRRFVRHMRGRLRATGRYTRAQLAGLDSVYAIDDRITAPSFGFRDAEHYYSTQSCKLFLEGIGVPSLLIQAKDDTFIPFELYEHHVLRRNANLRLIATEHGGHLGFISRKRPRFWVDEVILEWIAEQRTYSDARANC